MFKSKKILIVEDDLVISEMYANKLEKEGFEIDWAKDGEGALEKLGKTEFDLILLDKALPDMDGFEILKKIKTNPKLKEKIKVVALTNVSSRDSAEEFLKLGADAYFIKAHFTPTEIITKIKAILGQKV